MKVVKKLLVFLLITISSFLIQNTILSEISWLVVYPNLLLIITVTFGFMRGQKDGVIIGLMCGFLMDIFFDSVIGFYMLIYMLIGFCNGYFRRLFYDDDVTLPIFMIGVSDFIYGIVIYLSRFLLRGNFNLRYCVIHIIIPEVVCTCLVTLIIYQFIFFINRKIEELEQRSAGKFV